jgi:hypothetical protein
MFAASWSHMIGPTAFNDSKNDDQYSLRLSIIISFLRNATCLKNQGITNRFSKF